MPQTEPALKSVIYLVRGAVYMILANDTVENNGGRFEKRWLFKQWEYSYNSTERDFLFSMPYWLMSRLIVRLGKYVDTNTVGEYLNWQGRAILRFGKSKN